MFKKRPAKPQYSLCERVTATATSPRHIRQLTPVGLKPGGGADTLALCGAKVAWDTTRLQLSDLPRILAHQHETYRVCTDCSQAAQALGS